jgi:hypothetical protein
MLLGAPELRASAPLGACAASGSAVPVTAFAAGDARPRTRTTRGGRRRPWGSLDLSGGCEGLNPGSGERSGDPSRPLARCGVGGDISPRRGQLAGPPVVAASSPSEHGPRIAASGATKGCRARGQGAAGPRHTRQCPCRASSRLRPDPGPPSGANGHAGPQPHHQPRQRRPAGLARSICAEAELPSQSLPPKQVSLRLPCRLIPRVQPRPPAALASLWRPHASRSLRTVRARHARGHDGCLHLRPIRRGPDG